MSGNNRIDEVQKKKKKTNFKGKPQDIEEKNQMSSIGSV